MTLHRKQIRTSVLRRGSSHRAASLGRRLGGAALTGALALAILVAVPGVSQAAPTASQASEVYVAFGGSSPALEAVDSTTGAEIDSVALAGSASSLAEYDTSGTAPSQVVAVESGGLQEVSPSKGTASTVLSLPATPSSVAIADVSPTVQDALVLLPSLDEVEVVNLVGFTIVGSLSLGFSSGSPIGIAANPDGQNAYVTDSTSHQVATLQYITTGVNWQVENTYTGGSSYDPTSIVVDAAYNSVIVSSGQDVDESSLSTGVVVAPSNLINIVCATGATAGALSLSGGSGNLFTQDLGADYVADVSLVSPYTVICLSSTFAPGPLAVTQDGGTLAVPSSSSSTLNFLSTIGSSPGTTENSLSLGATATAITPATDLSLDLVAFVAEKCANDLAMVDLTTGIVDQTVAVGSLPDAVAVSPDGQFAYVANNGSGTVSVIQTNLMDTTSNPLVATITLPTGAVPHALALSPDGDQLLVVDGVIGAVSVIDTNPADTSTYRTVTSTICVNGSTGTCSNGFGPTAIAFSPDGSHAYVVDGGSDDITILDQSGGTYSYQTYTASLFTGTPQGIAIAPNDQTAYVTDAPSSGNGYLRSFPIDPANGVLQSGTSATVAQGPLGVSLSPQGGTAYVLNATSNTVSLVNTSTNAVTSVSVPSSAKAVAVTPDGSDFIAGSNSSTSPISIYSTASSSLSATVNLGSSVGPDAIAVGPLYNRPSGGSLAGYENDANPSVAASGNLDMEDGVNTTTGAYTFNNDDLSLPDIGIGLDLSQEYDSASSAVNGPLGFGWSFSYGMTLTQVPSTGGASACDITITQQNGTPVVFYPPTWSGSCPTSGYEPATFEQASLTTATCYGSETCWDMTSDGTTQYLFNMAGGPLLFERDSNGNLVTVSYSGGELQTVTGESGARQLTFTWTGGNITEVEDSAGRTAIFGYSGGNLTSLTLSASSTGDPTSHEWAFSYNTSHGLTRWWSPDNEGSASTEATRVTYNSGGEVTEVQEPDWLTQCNGASGTPACAPTTTFAYPSYDTSTGTGTVLVSDPNENYDDSSAAINDGNGDVTLDSYSDGVLLSQVKGYGYETDNSTPYTHYPMASAVTTSIPDPFSWLPATSLDADGNLTTTSYDSSGNVIATVHPMGRTTSSVYNRFNEVSQTTDPMGYVTSSTYDSSGNKLTSTDADGNETKWTYGSGAPAGLPHSMTDPLGVNAGTGGVTTYGYDSEGDLTSTTDPDGDVSTSIYNSAGEMCATLSADGYAAGDRLPGTCPSAATAYLTATTAYDVFGNALTVLDPSNTSYGSATWSYFYDADGNEVATTTSLGSSSCALTSSSCAYTTYTTYDPDGNETSQIKPPPSSGGSQSVTTNYFDPDGNKVEVTDADGSPASCDPLSSTSCSHTFYTTYNDLGQAVSSETAGADATTSAYDADSNLISTTTPPTASASSGMTTTNAYDGDGHLCATLSPLGYAAGDRLTGCPSSNEYYLTSYGYDADGSQICTGSEDAAAAGYYCPDEPTGAVTDTTTNAYDGDGNLVETTNQLGNSTWDFYDADGNEAAVTNADGNGSTCNPITYSGHCADTTYDIYDTANRLTETLTPPNPSSGTTWEPTSFTYDADGNEKTLTDPDDNVTTDAYDGANELTGVSYSGGTHSDETPASVSYVFNADGTKASMTDGTGTSTYSYDEQGRVVATENGAGETTTYGYDAASNQNCVTYPGYSTSCAAASAPPSSCSSSASPSSDTIDYQYDTSGRMCKVTDWLGNTFTYAYDSDSENTSMQASGTTANVTVTDSYDGAGRLNEVAATTGSTNLYTETYSLDADGVELTNTPSSAISGFTSSLEESYTPNNMQDNPKGYALSSGPNNITYDPAGPVTEDASVFTSSQPAQDGQMCWSDIDASSNSCSSVPNSVNATGYKYDPDGHLNAETPGNSSTATTTYGWNAADQLACENTSGSSCSLSSPSPTTTTFAFTGDGNLASWTTGASGSQAVTTLSWSAATSNALLASATTTSSSTMSADYVLGLAGAPLEQIKAAGSSINEDLLLRDASGSADGLVRLSGSTANSLVNMTEYGPGGEPESEQAGGISNGLQGTNAAMNSAFTDTSLLGFAAQVTEPGDLLLGSGQSYSPSITESLDLGSPSPSSTTPEPATCGNPTPQRADTEATLCNGFTANTVVNGQSGCSNCFASDSVTACDGVGPSCFVDGATADWSETLSVTFKHSYHAWVEGGSQYPGTSWDYEQANIPLWGVDGGESGSGWQWNFARAWGNPGYILVRDEFDVSFGIGWFSDSWHLRIWMNCYPRGMIEWGVIGSTP